MHEGQFLSLLVVVNCMCQLDRAMGRLDIWSDVILVSL